MPALALGDRGAGTGGASLNADVGLPDLLERLELERAELLRVLLELLEEERVVDVKVSVMVA